MLLLNGYSTFFRGATLPVKVNLKPNLASTQRRSGVYIKERRFPFKWKYSPTHRKTGFHSKENRFLLNQILASIQRWFSQMSSTQSFIA